VPALDRLHVEPIGPAISWQDAAPDAFADDCAITRKAVEGDSPASPLESLLRGPEDALLSDESDVDRHRRRG